MDSCAGFIRAPLFQQDAPSAGRDHAAPVLTRRWTINGDFLGLKPTGVARYAREVTLALDALVSARHPLTQGLELTVVAPRAPEDGFALGAIPVKVVPEFRTPRLPQVWVQLQLPFHVKGGLLSFCNLAPLAAPRQILCIHDMQTRLTPESYGFGFRLAHRLLLPLLGRRAAAITTVSCMSAEQIVRFRVAEPGKISITHNGSDHARRWQPEHATARFPQERPFVLALARDQAHKNMELLHALAAPLDALGIDLVLAGADGPGAFSRLGPMPENVHFLTHITDDDLAAGLSQALAFLLPSRTEGFGLPAVEAMVWGCPVIAADAPALPQICGEAADYAGPDAVEDWIAAITRLMDDPEHRQRQIAAGHGRARLFTWPLIAEQYLRLMADLDGAP
ncbi:glycosyl transferase [Azorhizobium oxalatiphilum]|uniref:Glycosyl transferase n=1 Tax=Azorhizobium oxalatiphilum TaxID=980631 RepID=A0A917BS17_9HYPH|nr:glycosyltransferase family 1 protein [Azorhizobium oxalatiphilum]GGF54289.1 glycosyl transferase [Azorhizobium oxalatiphilum]